MLCAGSNSPVPWSVYAWVLAKVSLWLSSGVTNFGCGRFQRRRTEKLATAFHDGGISYLVRFNESHRRHHRDRRMKERERRRARSSRAAFDGSCEVSKMETRRCQD